MDEAISTGSASSGKHFEITRSFDAPPKLVWQMWTQEQHLAQWWGPHIFENRVVSFELGPGKMFHYAMKRPDGVEMYGRFIWGELAPPRKLEYVSSFADAQGNAVRAPWDPTFPLELANTITLEPVGEGTLLTLRSSPVNPTAEEQAAFEALFSSMQQGFSGTLDQLEKHLSTSRN